MIQKTNVHASSAPPTISVILPAYNAADLLERAIASVMEQSFPHWELLAIDDGSSDETYDNLLRWAKAEERIHVTSLVANTGAAAARNQALRQARGEIVTYLDCFDEYYPDYLQQVQEWLLQSDVCLFCYDLVEGVNGGNRQRRSWDPVIVCEKMMEANITSPLGIAHRRELLDRSGLFEETMRSEEDWDLLKRFARAGASFLFLPVKSGLYHPRPGGRTRTRRLAELQWQANGSSTPISERRAPRMVCYTASVGASANGSAERAEAHCARGISLAQEGRTEEALAVFRDALRFRPDHSRANFNLGVALANEKRHSEALASFRAALRCQSNYAEAHYCLGNSLAELGRPEEAVSAFQAAIQIKPDFVEALNNLGLALTRLGRGKEAAIYLRQAVRLRPDFHEGHNNLGLAYMEQADFATAQRCFEEVLRLNPRYPDAHTNLGSAFKEQGRLEEAMASYDLSIALEPGAVTPHWNRSLAWLQVGNYEQGWREYEWRWKRKETVQRPFQQPQWDGSPLHGQTILLHVEQGLGDMIQFIRYATLVKARGGRVLVAAPLEVVGLFATCPGVDCVVAETCELPPFDLHAPLMSLPALFQTTVTTIPNTVPYLSTDPARLERWRERLRAVTGIKVGIAWQGNPRHKLDRHRSFPVSLFEPLARIPGVSLVSIQKGPGAEQLPLADGRFSALDLGSELRDFADTAAVMRCLDLVVCCDTSVAHLAGALSVNVWLPLSTVVDWRWLLNREDSPWYPTMRLFRQARLGEWKPVFRRMAIELKRLARETKSKRRTSERGSRNGVPARQL